MRIAVGTMTGTSMDAIDAVAVQIDGHALQMTAKYLGMATVPMGSLQNKLVDLVKNMQTNCPEVELQIGNRTKEAIQLLDLESIDLIAMHGQTIFHKPPKSVQLIDPMPIVNAFQCPVLTNPRQADLKLGGEGAPITPLADWVMFKQTSQSIAIVNLGGYCNITILPKGCSIDEIQGYDLCCCNLILDAIARKYFGSPFDEYGKHALKGDIQSDLFNEICFLLSKQYKQSCSLGHLDNLDNMILNLGKPHSGFDFAKTACAAIGKTINNSLSSIDTIYLAGGGANNGALTKEIKHNGFVSDLNVPIQAREGMAMGILGALAQDGISITLPQITGRNVTDQLVGWTQASP